MYNTVKEVLKLKARCFFSSVVETTFKLCWIFKIYLKNVK